MAREIELKFQIKDLQFFNKFLYDNKIVLSEPHTQHDTIFMRTGKNFCDLQSGEVILRIRKDVHGITTTAKKYIKGIQIREEAECRINDIEKFTQYLRLLDYVPLVNVIKKRQQGVIDNMTITYDIVDELGIFAEIEILSTADENEEALNTILDLAKRMGFNENDIISTPYDEMIYNKRKKEIKND